MGKEYRHSYIDVNGVNTHYIEAGKKEPLVLVHGGGAGSSAELNYGDVIGPLGGNFHAIAPDIIGYGFTTPRGPQDYWGQAQGEFLIQFLEAINEGPVFLGGNSYGGFAIQYAAHKRPDLVRRLILINSLAGTVPVPETEEGRNYFMGPAGRKYEKITIDQVKENLNRFYMNKNLVTEERVKLYFKTYMHNYKYAEERSRVVGASFEAANKHRSYKGKNIAEWAGDLEIPVLLTWSEPGSKLEWGLSYLKKNPGAEMHIFPWSGHHVQADQLDRWVQVVTNWLKNEPARLPN